jgi:hypothetical protein
MILQPQPARCSQANQQCFCNASASLPSTRKQPYPCSARTYARPALTVCIRSPSSVADWLCMSCDSWFEVLLELSTVHSHASAYESSPGWHPVVARCLGTNPPLWAWPSFGHHYRFHLSLYKCADRVGHISYVGWEAFCREPGPSVDFVSVSLCCWSYLVVW